MRAQLEYIMLLVFGAVFYLLLAPNVVPSRAGLLAAFLLIGWLAGLVYYLTPPKD